MKVPVALKPLAFKIIRALPSLERRLLPSAGYRKITLPEARRAQNDGSGWRHGSSAAWQQAAYDKLLAGMDAGEPRDDLIIAAQAVDCAGLIGPKLLEIGCGGGYHSYIFEKLCATKPQYSGTDYSAEMVASARKRFPHVSFEVADATALPYADASFDVVFDGVALMHILDYRSAIAEMVRCSRTHVIFHCIPVFDDHPTEYLFKYAYGQPVTEMVHSRAEIERVFNESGLVIEKSWCALPYDVSAIFGAQSHSRTYLCRKKSNNAD